MANSRHKEIEVLLDLARDKSVAARTRLVQIVGDLFFNTEIVLSDRERALMQDILRQLIHDAEMTVRRLLAERMAPESDAPPELLSTLANDEIEVAYPILTQSMVLQDIELIEIVEHRTLQHQLAIANRRALSENVSDALAGTGHVDVVKTLLENHGAEISQTTMAFLVDESERVDAYQNPLLRRQELTPQLAQRMYWWVSAALREYIVENFDVDPTEIEQSIQSTVQQLLDAEQKKAAEPGKGEELARQLNETDSISVKLMTDSLRQGEVALFEDLFAELTSLAPDIVRHLVYQPGGQPLAIACRSLPVAKADFATIFLLSRSARPGDKVVDPNELTNVMNFYDSISVENARKVLRRWRLDPNFRMALEQMGRGGGDKNDR